MNKFTRSILCWWLAAIPVLAHAQNDLFEQFGEQDGLPTNEVYDVCIGPDGQVWAATADGIAVFNGLFFERIDLPATAGGAPITGIIKAPDETIWCFTQGPQLFSVVNDRLRGISANGSLKKMLQNKIINQVRADQQGNLWLSTVIGGGLYRLSGNKSTVESVPLKEGQYAFYIKELADGSLICGSRNSAGDKNRLAVLLRDNAFEISLSGEGNFSKSCVLALKDGTFLYAKDYEVVHFDRNTVLSRTFLEKSIERLLQDADGKVWIAFNQGGVHCYPEGEVTPNGAIRYLSNQTIYDLSEDPAGNIWMGSATTGLVYMPYRQGLNYVAPKVYSQPDPLNEDPASTVGQAIRTFPEIPLEGIKIFRSDTIPPEVYINGVSISGKDTAVLEHYELQHDFQFLKVRYVGFASGNNEQVQYRYQLTGLSEEWVYTSSNEAQFTTLEPGEYTFSIMAVNKYGYWSHQAAKVRFTVHPPFYRTFWFIGPSLLVLGLLVWGGFYLYTRQVRRREREKAVIAQQLAEVELQALRAQMNPHFMFNTLSSIQHYITLNETEPALKYLSKFAKLMRRIIENSKKPVIPLKDEIQALDLYLQLEALRFKNRFAYSIDTQQGIDLNYDMIPSMLIQPYVENAILHGLMHKKEGGRLTVTLDKEDGFIVCRVADNGIGREASMAYNKQRPEKHASRGLSITKDRLNILNASRNSPLSVDIEDLYHPDGQAAGTRVTIHVPADR